MPSDRDNLVGRRKPWLFSDESPDWTPLAIRSGSARGMLPSSAFRFLYGDMSAFDAKKFGILAFMFFNLIGSYWLLRPLKDGVFYTIVGLEYLPTAKMLSFAVIIPLILAYSKMVDIFPRHKLIYIICGLYASLFGVITFCLTLPEIGLMNTNSSPDRWIGWITYFGIESFGSICVALFWSFVTSSTSATSAKKGYPLIVMGGQIGSILGPSLATQSAYFSIPNLFLIAVVEICLVLGLTYYYMVRQTILWEGGMYSHGRG